MSYEQYLTMRAELIDLLGRKIMNLTLANLFYHFK